MKEIFEGFRNLSGLEKTFLISQLGYLLSMMECSKKLMTEMQTDIDSFILKTSSHWISKDRIHLS